MKRSLHSNVSVVQKAADSSDSSSGASSDSDDDDDKEMVSLPVKTSPNKGAFPLGGVSLDL